MTALSPTSQRFMITGPRACGKTTTAIRRAASVLRLDEPSEASLFRGQPDDYLARLTPPILIDEWQEAPESMGAVKRAVDNGRGAGRFLVTGSVRSRTTTATWPGTGRLIPVPMYGLTRGEITGSTRATAFVERLFAGEVPVGPLPDAPTVFDYVEMAAGGGFPQAVGLPDDLRGDWYDGYVAQLVGRDVEGLAQIRSPQQMMTLLRAAALHTAGVPVQQTLAGAVGVDQRTVGRYLDLLQELGIIDRLPAWRTNRLNRMVKTHKLYLTDTGMAMWLADVDAEAAVHNSDLRGRIIDTFVAAQLRHLLQLGPTRVTAHHLRDQNGRREVDLILESGRGDIVAIEVKAAAGANPTDARHLAWLRDQVDDRFRAGVVFHTGHMAHAITDRIWALPIASIWN